MGKSNSSDRLSSQPVERRWADVWIALCGVAECFTNFNVPVLYSGFETWLRVHGWPVEYASIFQSESGLVPGTFDAFTYEPAFRERSAEMRAGFGQGEDAGLPAHQQDGNAIVLDALRLSIGQIRFCQNRYKVGRKCLTGGTVDSYSVGVN
jgi:hypothetical protein